MGTDESGQPRCLPASLAIGQPSLLPPWGSRLILFGSPCMPVQHTYVHTDMVRSHTSSDSPPASMHGPMHTQAFRQRSNMAVPEILSVKQAINRARLISLLQHYTLPPSSPPSQRLSAGHPSVPSPCLALYQHTTAKPNPLRPSPSSRPPLRHRLTPRHRPQPRPPPGPAPDRPSLPMPDQLQRPETARRSGGACIR